MTMDSEVLKDLCEIGLSEREGYVYITLLKLGEATAQVVAKHAELRRTTVYHILDRLAHLGLSSSIIKGKVRYFHASDPKLLLDIADDRKKRLAAAVKALSTYPNTLEEKPRVKYFEGKRGIKTVMDDAVSSKKPILLYDDLGLLAQVMTHDFSAFIRKRVQRRIPIKIICQRRPLHNEYIQSAKRELRRFVFIKRRIRSSIFIYNNKVAILHVDKEPYYGVLIEDKELYEAQKTIFELMWDAYK